MEFNNSKSAEMGFTALLFLSVYAIPQKFWITEKENPDSLSLSSGKILRLFRWREGTRHISVARLSKVQPWKVRKVIKICTTIGSFVKLHYFQFAFLENCLYIRNKWNQYCQGFLQGIFWFIEQVKSWFLSQIGLLQHWLTVVIKENERIC